MGNAAQPTDLSHELLGLVEPASPLPVLPQRHLSDEIRLPAKVMNDSHHLRTSPNRARVLTVILQLMDRISHWAIKLEDTASDDLLWPNAATPRAWLVANLRIAAIATTLPLINAPQLALAILTHPSLDDATSAARRRECEVYRPLTEAL